MFLMFTLLNLLKFYIFDEKYNFCLLQSHLTLERFRKSNGYKRKQKIQFVMKNKYIEQIQRTKHQNGLECQM